MIYSDLGPIGRDDAERALKGADVGLACAAVLRLALNEPDRLYVEGQIRAALSTAAWEVRAAACTAAGHVARIHGAISSSVVSRLAEQLSDRDVARFADDALDDVKRFTDGIV